MQAQSPVAPRARRCSRGVEIIDSDDGDGDFDGKSLGAELGHTDGDLNGKSLGSALWETEFNLDEKSLGPTMGEPNCGLDGK